MHWMLTRYFFDSTLNPGWVWDEEIKGVWKDKPSKEEILSCLPECFQTEEEVSQILTNGRTSIIDGEYYELYGFITWDEQRS